MASGLSTKLTGQVGEHLVCAELGRRGLLATPFAGNVPSFDVLVTNAELKTLPIQVKTSRFKTWPTRATRWLNITVDHQAKIQVDGGLTKLEHPHLIYICVQLGKPRAQDRFFVLEQKRFAAYLRGEL